MSNQFLSGQSKGVRQSCGVLVCILALLLAACSDPDKQSEIARAELAAKAMKGHDIAVGVVWNQEWNEDDLFFQGARLAQEEINQQGGLDGHLIKIIEAYDHADEETNLGSTTVARKLAAIPNLLAVIGHSTSASAIPASITYEHQGILFIAPAATLTELTNHNFQYLFRTIPDNIEQAKKMAEYANSKHYRNLAVIYPSDKDSEQTAQIFMEKSISKYGISIVYNKMFSEKTKNFNTILSEILSVGEDISKQQVDAIYFSGLLEQAARFIYEARKMGIHTPILGTDDMDSPELWRLSREKAAGTVVPTVFFNTVDTDDNTKLKHFNETFEKKFGKLPGTWSALAYDAMQLLAFAINEAESAVPFKIATALRYMQKPWRGVSGCHRFTRDGNIVGKQIYLKEMNDHGQFVLLPGQEAVKACE
ncbi:MAG: ABC transporter substrate-binding protein [Magnetococcus sp. YQC-5]